jgi:hypothetical protein
MYLAGAAAVAAAIAMLAVFSSGGDAPVLPNPKHSDNAPNGGVVLLGDAIREIWTLNASPGDECGVPLIPRCTTNYGVDVINVSGTGSVWGWTPPGDLRAAQKYGRRLIADVEDRASTKAKPSAGWTGYEVDAAEQLALLAGGVTSHGYVFKNLKPVLARLASHGLTAYPQVYDSDNSTKPREFLRTCVKMYRDVGFKTVVPLFSASSGAAFLQEWIDECRVMGIQGAIYSLERMKQKGISCGQLV